MKTLGFALVSSMLLVSVASAQDGVGHTTQDICCGGGCCLIEGDCLRNGDTNPANACEMCDTSSSQTDWTDVSGCGGDTDAGSTTMGTDAGPTDSGDDDGGCSAGGGGASFGLVGLVLFGLLRRRG